MLVLLSACATTGLPPVATPQQKVVRLLEVGIGTANPDAIRPLLDASYTQHNPRVPDGPQGLLGFVESFRGKPLGVRPEVKVVRILLDGEYVLAHTRYKRRVPVAAFDLFRMRDGKFVEHWDVGQAEHSGAMAGPTEITDREHTEANKQLVRRYVEEALIQHSSAANFVGEPYIEHAAATPMHEEVRRVVGEGNFVVVQARARCEGAPCVSYDMFRVSAGKLVEHWSVFERIPERAANPNGML